MTEKEMQKFNKKWCGWIITSGTILSGIIITFPVCILMASSCSPKIIEKTVTTIEYRDRVVHDTATVEISYEVEKIVTKDTVSHLANRYAKSDAVVSQGLLHHSLESIPQVIEVPVEIHVTDTLWKEQEIKEVVKEIEKPLTWWQKVRLDAFWWLVIALFVALVWIFRKPIMKLFVL